MEESPPEGENGCGMRNYSPEKDRAEGGAAGEPLLVPCGTSGGRRGYSRSEMEALRFPDADEQRRRWNEAYRLLGPAVAREYDGLRARENHNRKPQQQQQQQQERGNDQRQHFVQKKKDVSKAVGEVFTTNTAKASDVLNLSDFLCDDTLIGNENENYVEDLSNEYENINNEDDSSSDEYDSIQRPALLVEGEPDFEAGPPQDGLEYLRRVRWEAAQIPKVKVAKLNLSKFKNEQTPYMPKIPEIAKCPKNLLPSKQWEDAFLADFAKLRQEFSLPDGSFEQPSILKLHKDPQSATKTVPTLTAILAMDAVSRAATLRNRICSLETAGTLSRDDCLWLFALCVTVDTPLGAGTCASLRCLLRKCSGLLARKSEPDDEVAMLSILVAITGKFFGQSDNKLP